MAEVFGVVVGAISFGVQLAESLQKVRAFCDTVKDAPERLTDIIDEIESLSDILTELEQTHSTHDGTPEPKMQRCVAACRKAVDRFTAYAESLESRMKRCKRRTSIRFAMNNENIEGVISRLESSKSNLVLAYMLYREAMADGRAAQVQLSLEAIVISQASLPQQDLPVQSQELQLTRPIKQSGRRYAGAIRAFNFRTPQWLSQTIWDIAVSQAISGWTVTLRSYSMVPEDSPVAQACLSGDTLRLRQLFDSRAASPFDFIMYHIKDYTFTQTVLERLISRGHTDAARLVNVYDAEPALSVWHLVSAFQRPPHGSQFDIDAHREHIRWLTEDCEMALDGLGPMPVTIRDYASATQEDASCILFWSVLDQGFQMNPSLLRSLLRSLDKKSLLSFQNPSPLIQSARVLAMARTYVDAVEANTVRYAADAWDIEPLLVAAIELGLDLYESDRGSTVLATLIRERSFAHPERGVFVRSPEHMQKRLDVWLELLHRKGIDLNVYGQEELRRLKEIRQLCEQPWIWRHYRPGHVCEDDKFDQDFGASATLLAFSYGAKPSDWKLWLRHEGDEFGGQFWEMVEQDKIEDRRVERVPGGWVDDGSA